MKRIASRTPKVLLALFLLTWIACVGDDPVATTSEGGPGEKCLANGTCNTGLDCVAGRCEPGRTADSGGGSQVDTGGGGTDASTEAEAGEAGVCKARSDDPPSVQCGTGICQPGFRCCAVNGMLDCLDESDPDCPDDKLVWSCEEKTDCLAGAARCCISGTPVTTGSLCTSTLEKGVSRCVYNVGDCADPTTDFVTCDETADCAPGAKCVPTEVQTPNFSVVVKICRPQ